MKCTIKTLDIGCCASVTVEKCGVNYTQVGRKFINNLKNTCFDGYLNILP